MSGDPTFKHHVVSPPSPTGAWENHLTLIYLIGGAGRCGKTELSLRILRAHRLPAFSTDLFRDFMESVDEDHPQVPPPWSDDEWMARADHSTSYQRLSPHLPRIIWGLRGVYGDAILEGFEVRPADVPGLGSSDEIRAVFLVRHKVDIEGLTGQTDRHDWLRHFGATVQKALVSEIERLSIEISDQAARLGIPAVDVSGDFEAAMASAAGALGLPLDGSP